MFQKPRIVQGAKRKHRGFDAWLCEGAYEYYRVTGESDWVGPPDWSEIFGTLERARAYVQDLPANPKPKSADIMLQKVSDNGYRHPEELVETIELLVDYNPYEHVETV